MPGALGGQEVLEPMDLSYSCDLPCVHWESNLSLLDQPIILSTVTVVYHRVVSFHWGSSRLLRAEFCCPLLGALMVLDVNQNIWAFAARTPFLIKTKRTTREVVRSPEETGKNTQATQIFLLGTRIKVRTSWMITGYITSAQNIKTGSHDVAQDWARIPKFAFTCKC